MKNFLITGVIGFIGNNYIKKFSNKNNLYYILLKKSKKNKKFTNSFKDKNKVELFSNNYLPYWKQVFKFKS